MIGRSVHEAFDVNVGLWDSSGTCSRLDEAHPLGIATDVDVVIGQVGDEVTQRVNVGQMGGVLGQPTGPPGRAPPENREDSGPAVPGDREQFVGEDQVGGLPSPINESDIARVLGQLLKQRTHGRHADARGDEQHLPTPPDPAVQTPVGTLDQHA